MFRTEEDRMITDFAVRFLRERSTRPATDPWMLYVGLFRPHFPLLCDADYFDIYFGGNVETPESIGQPMETQHPAVQSIRRYLCNEAPIGS